MKRFVLLLALVAAPAAAQTPACELHVWPAQGMKHVSQGVFQGYPGPTSLLDVAVRDSNRTQGAKDDAQLKAELAGASKPLPLAPSVQTEALAGMALTDALGLKNYTVVIHDTALDSRTVRNVKTRYIESAAPCYADLVVADLVFSSAFADGRKLKSFFRFRDFADQAAPVRSFGAWVDSDLQLFALNPPNVSAPALDELVGAFRANARQFAALANKRP